MKISDFPKYKKEFGFKSAWHYFYNNFMFKLTKNVKFKQRVYDKIEKYLDEKYGHLLVENKEENSLDKDFKVWVFWWQGEEKAPAVVKKCIETVKNNFKNNEVVVIDKDNYKKFADIPEHIIKKVENKIITLTHFSDILRATLLSAHGGVWMDATIYMTSPIDKDIEGCKFYSNHLPENKEYQKFISKAKWSAFFLAGGKGNAIFVNLRNILFEYWKTHNYLVDYFLIDYIIYLEYSKCDAIKKMIDAVPINNINIHEGGTKLFEKYSDELYEELTKDTKMFKLTYKHDPKKFEIENTLYKKLMEK